MLKGRIHKTLLLWSNIGIQAVQFNSKMTGAETCFCLPAMLYRHCMCCLAVPTISRQDQSVPEMQLNPDGTVIRPTSVRDRAPFVYYYCNSMAIDWRWDG